MSPANLVVGVMIATITTFGLAACYSAPANDPISIDAQYGIPPYSVPSNDLRPDGLMNNGLLPAQPNDTGG